MSLRINKFKVTKSDKISIQYEQYNDNANSWDEYSLLCADKPKNELFYALAGLNRHVVDMCELPDNYVNKIKVTGVSFSYAGEEDVMGAVITSQMELLNSSCALNLNTPHKISEFYGESGDEKQLLSGDCVDDLLELCNQLKLYIKGERAQLRLYAL